MTRTTMSNEVHKDSDVLHASMTFALILAFSVPSYATDVPSSVSGRASDALVTLATTGNPEPLHADIGGTVISSEALQKQASALMKLDKKEHLAPKALVAPNGETYAMVAPTITKDNFIFVDSQGNVLRMDVGASEGHRMPFVVQNIVEDGGTPWYVEFWHWIAG
ncbi:hypothetical protein YTPLAS18_30040 [Nitrospira sp.]|nr:hypothetical protein YTPLAS18_30040 [Nitrospira sp.]